MRFFNWPRRAGKTQFLRDTFNEPPPHKHFWNVTLNSPPGVNWLHCDCGADAVDTGRGAHVYHQSTDVYPPKCENSAHHHFKIKDKDSGQWYCSLENPDGLVK